MLVLMLVCVCVCACVCVRAAGGGGPAVGTGAGGDGDAVATGIGSAGAVVAAGLADRIAWFRAAGIMGGDGVPAVVAYGVTSPADMARFVRVDVIPLDGDVLEMFERRDTPRNGC